MEQESWPRAGAVPRNEAHGHGAPRGEPRRSAHDTAYAALDLGTNNCRLLIARPTDSGFRIVDSFSRIIRLGEGISQTGRHFGARDRPRAVGALRICRDKIVAKRAGRTRLIATEACRAAVEPGRISRAGRSRTRHSPRGDRPRDRSDAGGHRLPAVARSARERCDPVRYRRRIVGTGAAGLRSGAAAGCAEDRRMGLAAGRRRDAGRAPRRRACHARILCGDGRRSRGDAGAVRASARRQPRRHASVGHLRHGDDRRRHLPQPAALRPPPGGRHLDERRRRDAAPCSGCWR